MADPKLEEQAKQIASDIWDRPSIETREELADALLDALQEAVAEERKALRDKIGSLCNFRAISWSPADDERSQDYRDGIEQAAIQLRDRIRGLIDAREGSER